mgnify:CR=1 FL=1
MSGNVEMDERGHLEEVYIWISVSLWRLADERGHLDVKRNL